MHTTKEFCKRCGRVVDALIYFHDENEYYLLCPMLGCGYDWREDRGRPN